MHREYEQVCKAQQEAIARNKLLLEDVKRLQRQLATPARSKLQQLKSRYEEDIIRLYPTWLEQVQQFKRKKEVASLSGASQQSNSSHALFVAPTTTSNPILHVAITTTITSSTSSHVSSESLTTPSNGYSPSSKPLADFNQSNKIEKQGHTPQHSDISLASLSSGLLDHSQDEPVVHSTAPTGDNVSGNHLSHDLSASGDPSISHDVSSDDDDDFWNSGAPPITIAETAAPPIATVAIHLPAMTAAHLTTISPPHISTSKTSLTYTTAPPPTCNSATVATPICNSSELPPINSSTITTPIIPSRTDVTSLFVVTTSATPITTVATPTSSSSISVTPISDPVTPPISSSTSATPIISASESATPITDAMPTASNVIPVVTTYSSSGSATPISGSATPPRLSLLVRPAANDSANQNAVQQPSVPVLECSTSAGLEEHVPLTETAAYQSLAKSIHHHDNSSSEISEGSAVLELEQLNTLSPIMTRQEGSPLHSDENTHGVKVTRQLVTMDTDDESSVSLSPSGGGGGYIPSTLEQHSHRRTTPTSHIIDLKKLGILGGSEEELDELPIAAATSDTAQSNQLDEFDFYN